MKEYRISLIVRADNINEADDIAESISNSAELPIERVVEVYEAS
jgi:hypothetical protein